jgi:manganese/zinc/iron transport system permease protein
MFSPWTHLDLWIVATGATAGVACALVGVFLLLRKLSMMGDAISHAVLPGLVLGFLITGTRDAAPMFLSAVLVGILTAYLTQLVRDSGKVDEGAAMGVVFTSLFALGLMLVVRFSDRIDLDPSCVLYGTLENTPLDTYSLLGLALPRAFVHLVGVCIVNALAVLVFYKELKLTSFDPALASALGIPARFIHYLLMTLVAVTTVAAFEAVGSILVVAMLIVPAAVAMQLTHRLSTLILLSAVVAAASAVLGHFAAIELPRLFGYGATYTSGMIAVAAGFLLALAITFAPDRGLLPRAYRMVSLRLAEARDDILATLYRDEEHPHRATILDPLQRKPVLRRLATWQLRRSAEVAGEPLKLTPAGRDRARVLIRSHRLWESFLADSVAIRVDHVHRTAEKLEHLTTPDIRAQLAANPRDTDPQGRIIPPESGHP